MTPDPLACGQLIAMFVGGGGGVPHLVLCCIQVSVAFRLMSFGLMSPSALCHSRPYVVRLNVAFGLMLFGLVSHLG